MEAKKTADGWDLHVLYLRGESVLEVYKRSRTISEYEFNMLLKLQAAGGFWKKVERNTKAAEDGEESPPTAFGHDMERSDGKVRAKKLGDDSLLVYNAELDTRLTRSRKASLRELAPASVSGF